MKKDLTDKLHNRYTWLKELSFWCGDGWYDLLHNLFNELEMYYDQNGADIYSICIDEVKEKYGGLRCYVSNEITGVYNIIFKYEEQSLLICEMCSKPGILSRKGEWLKTLCSSCAIECGYIVAHE